LESIVLAIALAAMFVPLTPELVERYYARAYQHIQAAVTSWSNRTALSLFDMLLLATVGGLGMFWARRLRRVWRHRSLAPLLGGLLSTAALAGALYLWFAVIWGFNYDRPSMTARPGFVRDRVTPDAVLGLGLHAVSAANARHSTAHARGFPGVRDVPADLVRALHQVEAALGRPRPTVPGRPKRTLLVPFFRASGTDGMTAPFLLETLVNPDLTGPERPIVLAHEWAHLSGYAPEGEAGFIGALVALRGDVPAQYSAWLSIALDVAGQLPRADRHRLLERLDPGPRRDHELIAARLLTRVPSVERASRATYDRYLRSQGVAEGIQSYGRVVELLVGMDPSHPLSWRNP
jgi:hypothetical protein